ncbi:hypothetical protein BH20ACT15_BH20ACT15_06190 [soil metagenome]
MPPDLSGRDFVKSRDGKRDVVRCGKGKDRAVVDRRDKVKGCESVRRPGSKKKKNRKRK